LTRKAYETETGANLEPLRLASKSQLAALTSPLFKGSAIAELSSQYLLFKDLKWWGNFFAVLGAAIGLAGVVAAPFSMGAGLGLAVVGGILALVGIGITWYADSSHQGRYSVIQQANGVTLVQIGSSSQFEYYRRKIEAELERQRLLLKEQEHMDDLQNAEIWRQNCEIAHVREISRVQAECEMTFHTLLWLELKPRKSAAAKFTNIFHMKLQESLQTLAPDFSASSMSPEFLEKLKASWGRLEDRRIKALQAKEPYTFRISHTVKGPTIRDSAMSFTFKVEQLSGRPVDTSIVLVLDKSFKPNHMYEVRQDRDGVWHWPVIGGPLNARDVFTLGVKFYHRYPNDMLFSASHILTRNDGSSTVEHPPDLVQANYCLKAPVQGLHPH
jgi:hypothetical protein